MRLDLGDMGGRTSRTCSWGGTRQFHRRGRGAAREAGRTPAAARGCAHPRRIEEPEAADRHDPDLGRYGRHTHALEQGHAQDLGHAQAGGNEAQEHPHRRDRQQHQGLRRGQDDPTLRRVNHHPRATANHPRRRQAHDPDEGLEVGNGGAARSRRAAHRPPSRTLHSRTDPSPSAASRPSSKSGSRLPCPGPGPSRSRATTPIATTTIRSTTRSIANDP